MPDLLDAISAATNDDTGIRTGTIATLSPLTVSLQGGTVKSPGVLRSYSPALGDTVILLRQGDSWLCLGSVAAGRAFLGANSTTLGTVATSPGGGGEVAIPSANWQQEPTYLFRAGLIFQIMIYGLAVESSGTFTGVVRVREGQASTTGTILQVITYVQNGAASSWNMPFAVTFFVKNAGSTAISSKLSMTVQHFTVGTSMSIYGDGTQPCAIVVEEADTIALNSNLATLAISL